MKSSIRARRRALAGVAVATLALGTGVVTTAAADASTSGDLASGISKDHHSLGKAVEGTSAMPRGLARKAAGAGEPGSSSGLPAGVPKNGRYAFLLKLTTRSTATAFNGARGQGVAAARSAAEDQLGPVIHAQNAVIGRLPAASSVLYRTHSALAAVAVVTDVHNFAKLQDISGVAAVYPIAPKSPSNSYAVPLQGAPAAWTAYGDLGANATVGIIDTGIDYTHADFGGEGTKAAYQTAKAALGADPADFPGTKVAGGYDLAGDSYNADPTSPDYNPVPSPDPYPLDCNSHGTHVAGTVAGYGENADGSTYSGAYDSSTPFDQMRIGPGMAPKAKLYGFRVFGCAGSTDLVSSAIDRAMDPNQDGDISDHMDVVNMSLGSDYGSPQDGDSVMTQAASAAGMTMVVASGNAGDLYDVGGSPGDATRAITAAASVDASAQVDALEVTAPAGEYAAERSVAYDWGTKPDLGGDVVQLSDPGNRDGCQPLSPSDAAAVNGKIAFVEWTDDSTVRRCGSVGRSGNLAAAGATGFVFGDDQEHFAAGITGSTVIPGVLVAKSGADAIRSALAGGTTVTIGGTVANGFNQVDPSLNDTLASFSSRGIGDTGNVKPDVAAVGDSVFSAGNGTGNEGLNDSGTSMATPMVAGTAALVRSMHRDWNPEQTKADIMNTAGQDVFTGTDHSGDKYAPQRVGAGRIQVKQALDNDVLAYVADDPGAVSASFGQLEVTAPQTLTKTIKVQNTGLAARTYDVTYDARTSIPGATYSVSPATVTVDPRSTSTVTVTLSLDPKALTKTIDPTVARSQGGLPRQYQADASGLVVLTGSDVPSLRVPVYAAPRPASQMTQPASLTMPNGGTQTRLLPLQGQGVDQGSGETRVQSLLAGFELQATSGSVPDCSATVTSGCVDFADERSADLKYVGTTSDAPQYASLGEDPVSNGLAYFSVTTQHPWRTPSGIQEFDIWIDGTGDGQPDAVAFNTRLSGTDIMVSKLVDLSSGKVVDTEILNGAFGDTDTALLNSDTMVIPVAISAIPGVSAGHSRIHYGIQAYTSYQSAPLDEVGMDAGGNLVKPLSFDVLKPGLVVRGSFDRTTNPLLYADMPSSVVQVTRDNGSYAADHGLGALLVHFQNKDGDKAQVVALNNAASVGLRLTPNPASRGATVTGTVTVPDDGGTPATGAVTLKQGTTTLASGNVVDGTATLTFKAAKVGSYAVHAEYAGDANYQAGSSAPVTLKVTKATAAPSLVITPNPVKHGSTATATVRIATVDGTPATGRVVLRNRAGTQIGTGTLAGGVAKIRFAYRTVGNRNLHAEYAGDASYLTGTSPEVKLAVS